MTGLRGGAAKAGLLALEVLGVALAAVAAAAGYLAWRIQSGPVSVSLFRDSAEFAVERVLPKGHRAVIGDLILSRGGGRGEFQLALVDGAIFDRADESLVSLARIDAVFAVEDLARGAFGPRRLEFDKPLITFTRRDDGIIKADAGGHDRFDLIRLLKERAWLRETFRSAAFRDATIVYRDQASGRSWRSDGASAELARSSDGFAASADGVFDMDGKAATLALDARFFEARRIIDAELQVANAPVGDILGMFYGDAAAILSAPISGSAKVRLTDKGAVVSSTIDLKSGNGLMRLGGASTPVRFVSLKAAFDPKTNAFDDVHAAFDVDGTSGAIDGRVALALADDRRNVRALDFALTGQGLTLKPGGFFTEPLELNRIALEGRYEIPARRLTLSAVEAAFLDVVMKGAIDLRRAAPGANSSPAIKVALRMDGALDPSRILRGWPQHLAIGVREFIATRLPAAQVQNLAFALDLPMGAFAAGKAMPDEAMTLTFDVSGATAIYTPGMTPLSAASGKAKLTGNRFVISEARGRVGSVAVSNGVIDFTHLSPKGAPVTYTFDFDGAAKDILNVLNEEPLALLKSTRLSPDQFVGMGRARVRITRPNLRLADRSAYEYAGVATFQNLTVTDFYHGIDLMKATGKLDLKSKSMNLVANADFGGSPIRIDWLQRFYAAEGRSNFKVSGTIDSTTGDVFGVPTRQFMRGPVDFSVAAAGELGAIESLQLEADFTKASLTLESLGWRKPQGVRAIGKIESKFDKGAVSIERATLDGEDIAVDGAARFSAAGVIEEAAFQRFYLGGAADFSVSASRNETGALDATLTGSFLNSGHFVKRLIAAPPRDPEEPDPWSGGLHLRARVDELVLRGDTRYRDASLDLRSADDRLQALDFSARTAAGKPVAVNLKPTGAQTGPTQMLEARSDDIGALLAGVFGVTSITGGEGSMEMSVRPKTENAPGVVEGVLEARGMRVVKAPLLARVFAAGSFDGLSDLLNGQGIELAKARADFAFSDGVVRIRDARATGPSVGITGAGEISTGAESAVSLSGAIAPAYQVNSLLGKAPLVGGIFVNRAGEGLVALSYNVTGPASAPTVSVNPLSALAPGVIRRMFEGRDTEAKPGPSAN